MLKRLILGIFLSLTIVRLEAQETSKNVQRADRAFADNNYKKALENYLKATSEEAVTAYLARQVGNCYRLEGDLTQAEIWYENAVNQPDHTSLDFLLLGNVQKANGKDELSAASLSKLYTMQMLPDNNSSSSEADPFVNQLRTGFINFHIVPLTINSQEADFSPSICRDVLVFATSRFDRELAHHKQINPSQHLNIYSAKLSSSGDLSEPVIFSNDLLSQYYTGPITFSPTGDTAYFVRKKYLIARLGDERQQSDNNLKIHMAIYKQGIWVDQGPLSFCSDSYSVGDPNVSTDGKKLFFTSDMPGGRGGTDLYYREINRNGTFGEAINLGPKVNTSGNEMNPFVAKDGTLFFSSDTQPGLGNLDLFAASPTSHGYDYVTNLGYPINGPYDDFGLTLNQNGNLAFFSSNRPDGVGDDDIYKIEIEKKSISHSIEGLVVDEKNAPVANSMVKMFNGKALITSISTDEQGKFSLKLEDNHEVNLTAECTNFFPATAKVSTFGLGLKSTQIPVKITLIHDAGYTLTGTIVSATDGSALAGARAIVLPPDTIKSLICIADQSGHFSLKLSNDTDYRIRLEKEGFANKWLAVSTKNRERGEINLSALFDTKLLQEVKPGISGTVTDLKTSLPLSNVIITLISPVLSQYSKLATNESGMFIQTNLPEGEYTVKIEKEGYKPLTFTIMLGKQMVNLNSSNSLALEPLSNSLSAVGLVSNKDDNSPLTEVTVSLLNKATNEKIQKHTDEFGSFDFQIEPDHIYILKLEKDKFFSKTLMVSTQGLTKGMLNLNASYDLKMEAIVMNKAIEIPNIYYDLGKATIKPEAAQELDKVVKLLSDNPTIQIELSSHTDARGDSKQNQILSQKRAEAAMNYIVSKGIEKLRIIAKGYGDTMIKNHCKKGVNCSEEEHAVNRRTEIKVIEF